jgi:hypothetical protein
MDSASNNSKHYLTSIPNILIVPPFQRKAKFLRGNNTQKYMLMEEK